MSNNKDIGTRPRSMSAKGPSNRSRPMSGLTTTAVKMQSGTLKTQLISNIYQSKQKSPGKRSSTKNLFYPGISTEQLAKFKRTINIVINKSKEQLYEQNILHKKQINRLSQQLTILKGKGQSKSKKVLQKYKQLDMQFQKQMFWNGSKAHLISGIKYQYEKLKKQYQQQTKQYNELKVALLESKVPQYKIYSQAVQIENKRLLQRLRKIMQSQKSTLRRQQTDKQVMAALLKQYEQNRPLLQQKLVKLDTQLRNANESIKDKDKKLQFLQKLIIQKDNKQYHIGRKLKKTLKLKDQLQGQNQELKKIMNKNEQQKNLQIKNMIADHQQQIIKIQAKLKNQISQRNNKIKLLQQQIKSLQNTLNKLRMSSSILSNSHVNMPTNRSNVNQNAVVTSTRVSIPQKNSQQSVNKIDNYDSVQSKDINQPQQKNDVPQFRAMQKADKKHSGDSKKSRKVQFFEIEPIGQVLRYRMINNNIDQIELKQCFSNKGFIKQKKSGSFVNDQKWDDQYICMAEVQHILKSFPFNLDQNIAFKLARYMIQDCYQEYVYTDPKNQNTRDIIKSIIKAVVGQYTLFDQETKLKAKQFLSNYETNVRSALKTYYPSGKVTKKKFLDTINNLGVQIDERVAQYLLAEAFKKSKSLQQIQYNHLFTN